MEPITQVSALPEVTAGQVDGELALKVSLIAAAATVTSTSEPLAPEPITLDEAKAHLRVIGSDEDGHLTGLIIAAREMAEGRLNRTIRQRAITEVFSGWHEGLVLPKPPVVSVESITYTDADGTVQTLPPEDYYAGVHVEPAIVELAPGFRAPALHFRRHPIAVTYIAGYGAGDVPRAIIQWMLLAIGAMYQNRESVVTGISVAALPEDFMQLLIQPYRVYE